MPDPPRAAHFDTPQGGPSARRLRAEGWAALPPGESAWLAVDGVRVAPLDLRFDRPDVVRALGNPHGRGFATVVELPEGGRGARRLELVCEHGPLATRKLEPRAGATPLEELPPRKLAFQHLTACNLRCAMCPAHAEDNRFAGRSRLAPRALFERIAEYVERARPAGVTLNGWGEPLMNKDLFHYVEVLKRIDPAIVVSTTTNGTLLEGERAERLLASGIDAVAVSLDAGCAETYERIRIGARWDEVRGNLAAFVACRDALGAKTRVMSNFVLMRGNLGELPAYVEAVGELGADAANTVNAHSAYSVEGDSGVFDAPGLPEPARAERERIYLRAREAAARHDVDLRLAPPRPTPAPSDCSFGGSTGAVIATDGDVFPCCVLYARHEEGDPAAQPMGNLHEDDLETIWQREEYVAFRRGLVEGKSPHPLCAGCPFLFGL